MAMRLKGQWFLMTEKVNGTMVPMTDDVDGTVVPGTEVNLAEGQYEQSIQDTNDFKSEAKVRVVVDKDSVQDEMLKSISTCALPMGTLDGRF